MSRGRILPKRSDLEKKLRALEAELAATKKAFSDLEDVIGGTLAKITKAEAELAETKSISEERHRAAHKFQDERDALKDKLAFWRDQAKNLNDEWKRAHVPGWAEKEVTVLLQGKERLKARVAELERHRPHDHKDLSLWIAGCAGCEDEGSPWPPLHPKGGGRESGARYYPECSGEDDCHCYGHVRLRYAANPAAQGTPEDNDDLPDEGPNERTGEWTE